RCCERNAVIQPIRLARHPKRLANLRERLYRTVAAGSSAFHASGGEPQVLFAALYGRSVREADAKYGLRALREDRKDAVRLPVATDHERPSAQLAHRHVAGRRQYGRIERLRFPLARPRRQDDEVARLEAAGQAVEVGNAGGAAGDLLLPLVELLDRLAGP